MSDGRKPPGPDPASVSPEHDAWLREALRHAPDASATPPPTLRDAILAEARAAARTATTPRAAPTVSLPGRVLELWSWLARPQVAAGFASVMAATLVGMLWWDRPMDEAMAPPPSSAPVAAPAAPAVGAQQPTPPVAAKAREPAAPTAVAPPVPAAITPPLRDAAKATAAKSAPPAASPEGAQAMQERTQPALPRGSAQSAGRVGPAAQPGFAAGTRREERKDSADKLDAMPSPQTSATTPAATTTPSPAAAAPTPFPAQTPADADSSLRRPAPARAEPFALAKKAEQPERERAASEAARPAGGLAAQNQAADVQPRQRAAAALAGSSAAPMSALLAALAAEGSRWSRPVAGGDNVVDAAVQTWLAQVQAAAATRWEPLADRPAQPGAATDSPAGASTLLLHRDGRPGLVVRIDDSGVFFDPRSGPAWFARLPPEVAARLRATLPAATR